jgi:hypothetical protein
MTTLSQLRADIRLSLASTSDHPNATLDAWIKEGIRFYSLHFPRTRSKTLTLSTGTQTYDAPGGHNLRAILSVEYPYGNTPPDMLERLPYTDRRFDGGDYYDLIPIDADLVIESDDAASSITFGPTVSTGEFAYITYTTTHNLPTAGDDDAIISVPDQHLLAIQSYVEYRAACELENDEAVTVDTSNVSIVLAQLGQASRSAWFRYKNVLDRLKFEVGESATVNWRAGMDARNPYR